jgi:phytoene desaturase (3,4-didehydrolycopene-forming)
MGEKQRKKAIVVGAGVGGTATAARLAHAGLDVEVYEKNEFSGGRCSLIHHDGYRFDQVSPLLRLLLVIRPSHRRHCY